MSLSSIQDFVEPINLSFLSKDEGYRDTQLGKHIKSYENQLPDIKDADIVLIGAGECRGAGFALMVLKQPMRLEQLCTIYIIGMHKSQ